jgi:hypothetical protein
MQLVPRIKQLIALFLPLQKILLCQVIPLQILVEKGSRLLRRILKGQLLLMSGEIMLRIIKKIDAKFSTWGALYVLLLKSLIFSFVWDSFVDLIFSKTHAKLVILTINFATNIFIVVICGIFMYVLVKGVFGVKK